MSKTAALWLLRLIFFAWTGLVVAALHTPAFGNTIQLSGAQTGPVNIAPFADYLRDDSHALDISDVTQPDTATRFQQVGDVIDFGSKDATFWIRFSVKNAGDTAQTWILNTGSQRMRFATVHIFKQGARVSAVLDDYQRPFSERPIANRLLISELTLQPGEEAQIYYSYRSFKSSFFPVKIMSEDDFETREQRQLLLTLVIIGLVLMFAVYSAFMFFSLEDVVVIYYILFISFTLLYTLHQMGYTYAYLWPNAPVFNSRAAGFLGYASNVFGALYGWRFFTKGAPHRWLSRAYGTLITLSVIGACAALLSTSAYSHFIGTAGFLLVAIVTFLNFFVAIRMYLGGDLSAGIAALGWGVLIAWNLFLNALSLDLVQVPEQILFDNYYIFVGFAMVAETFFLTLALFVRVRSIIQANTRARSDYIRLLEQETQSLKATAQALRAKQAAEERAAQAGRTLERLAHDIRQPLFAAKLGLRNTRQATSGDPSAAQEAVNMIDDILTTVLERDVRSKSDVPVTDEIISLDTLFLSISILYTSQLRDKGQELSVVPSTAMVHCDRRVLVRILNNLVSNAIKHMQHGRILLGCRRRDGAVEIQVINQAREGFAETQTVAETDTGLGLKTVKTLSASIGAEFSITRAGPDTVIAKLRLRSAPRAA